VIVGGGSQYASGLVESLVDYARDMLRGSTVVLYDIKPENQRLVAKYADLLVKSAGVDIHFEDTTDKRRALEGADFILTTFRGGTFHEQDADESIPPRYGLLGQETSGVGGVFMTLRTVPLFIDLCRTMEELCPEAWLINYTNPTQYVADAVRRISRTRIISLCDGIIEVPDDLSPLLQVPPEDIQGFPAGVNHCTWIMRLLVKGEDAYPLLRERLKEVDVDELYKPPPDTDLSNMYLQFVEHYYFPLSLKLFKIFGLLPSPRYYMRYYYDLDNMVALQRSGSYVTMARYYINVSTKHRFEDLKKQVEKGTVELTPFRREGGAGHGDLAVRVIAAIANDLKETFVVNVPNQGAIANLPYDSIVEVPAVVDKDGAHLYAMGNLPKAVLGLIHSFVLSQELTVDAALSGRKEDVLKAILANPLVHSVEGAEGAMNELFERQAEWLPQFNLKPKSATSERS